MVKQSFTRDVNHTIYCVLMLPRILKIAPLFMVIILMAHNQCSMIYSCQNDAHGIFNTTFPIQPGIKILMQPSSTRYWLHSPLQLNMTSDSSVREKSPPHANKKKIIASAPHKHTQWAPKVASGLRLLEPTIYTHRNINRCASIQKNVKVK